MRSTERDDKERRKEELVNVFGMTILFFFGAVLLYLYYRIDNSETADNYLDISSGDPSGLRFIAFFGLLKYGILLVGATLTNLTPIMLIKKIKTPHNYC